MATILLNDSATIDALAKGSWTALHVVAWHGHIKTVRVLLAHRADVSVRSKTGWTALHSAASPGHTDLVRFLLEYNIDINARLHSSGLTALVYAASGGHVDAVRALLDSGAIIASSDNNGFSALDYAASKGRADVVRLLLERGAGACAKNLPRGYVALADVARRADAVRVVPDSWRDGEAEDVARALEGADRREAGARYPRRMRRMRKARSFSV
jgi:ankyrin repeat protein